MPTAKRIPEQLSFPGLDPVPTDRLFFAIYPDAPAARLTAEIAGRLCGQCGLKSKPIAPRRLHVSLHSLGDYAGLPGEIVAKACDAASMVAERSFGVAFDHVGSFVTRRRKLPLVLRGGSASLAAFQQALGEAMARTGLGCRVSPHYTPHMTLLYDARHVDARPVEPVAWTVREFVLIHSLLGKTRHIPLGRWPLRAG